jgi:predicted  nucleic acid-binding Zn-ribbon protein
MNQSATILQRLRKLVQFDAELGRLGTDTKERQQMQSKITALRAPLPTSILSHYDRCKARGKLCIAPVRHGVCGACHLALPTGRLADLFSKPTELNVCDNCGVFIYPADDEPAKKTESVLLSVEKTSRTKRTSIRRRRADAMAQDG